MEIYNNDFYLFREETNILQKCKPNAILSAKMAKSAGGFRFPPDSLNRPSRGSKKENIYLLSRASFVFVNFLSLNRRL